MISEERKKLIQALLDDRTIQFNTGKAWRDYDTSISTCYNPLVKREGMQWRIKPEVKVIDLGRLDTSCIVFNTDGDMCTAIGVTASFIKRPVYNHWNVWLGGDCPIPDGFEYEILFRNGDNTKRDDSAVVLNWEHTEERYDIIAYRFIKKLDDWVYPWEIEE